MSIFSKIIGASKAAKAHKKAQTPDPVAPSATPAPYRHVPTHAAIDAMSGAPSSWKEVDRFAIKAQHKRRSQMPKTNSSTSLHGNHSFGFNNNHTSYHGSEYGLMPGRVEARRSGTGYNPYQPSPLSSHGATPAISEVNSTSSSTSELLETSYAVAKYPQTYALHDPSKTSKRKRREALLLKHPPPIVPNAHKRRGWVFRQSTLFHAH